MSVESHVGPRRKENIPSGITTASRATRYNKLLCSYDVAVVRSSYFPREGAQARYPASDVPASEGYQRDIGALT